MFSLQGGKQRHKHFALLAADNAMTETGKGLNHSYNNTVTAYTRWRDVDHPDLWWELEARF